MIGVCCARVTTMKKRFLSWTQIEDFVDRMVARLPREYDALLAITRVSLVLCCLVIEEIDIRNILVAAVMYYTSFGKTMDRPFFLQFPDEILLAEKRILVIDD